MCHCIFQRRPVVVLVGATNPYGHFALREKNGFSV